MTNEHVQVGNFGDSSDEQLRQRLQSVPLPNYVEHPKLSDNKQEFEPLLGEYWGIAFSEGKTGVSRGDDANLVLHKIRAAREQPERVALSDIAIIGIASHIFTSECDGEPMPESAGEIVTFTRAILAAQAAQPVIAEAARDDGPDLANTDIPEGDAWGSTLDRLYAAFHREPCGDTLAAIGCAIQYLQAMQSDQRVDDLAALVRRLASSLSKAAPDNDLPAKAVDYLQRKGLQGSPLRDAAVKRDDVAGDVSIEDRMAAQAKPFESYLTEDDFHDLHRFIECCEDFDAGGHDVPKDRMRRLTELGVVRSCGFGRHEATAFGCYVHDGVWLQSPELPLKTIAERIERAAIATSKDAQ